MVAMPFAVRATIVRIKLATSDSRERYEPKLYRSRSECRGDISKTMESHSAPFRDVIETRAWAFVGALYIHAYAAVLVDACAFIRCSVQDGATRGGGCFLFDVSEKENFNSCAALCFADWAGQAFVLHSNIHTTHSVNLTSLLLSGDRE
jgi:hypothetical protein